MNFFYRHRVAFGAASILLAVLLAFGFCFFALSKTAAKAQRLTIVIDAGHGGVDGGVVGISSGVKESDVNLALSRILQRKFEETGFAVVQTRPSEAGLYGAATKGYKKRDMQERARIIRESIPVIVISVHQNFFPDRARRGAQVFFRGNSSSSEAFARLVQSSLNSMPECVKKAEALAGDYFILNCSEYPSAIVECGFLSNEEDERLLLDGEYREKIAEAVLQGALSFLSSDVSGE